MDKSRTSIGATGEADDEKVGRPDSFAINGYFGSKYPPHDPAYRMSTTANAAETHHPSQQFSRANLILAREYLHAALGEGLNSTAMSWVIKAIKELEK